MADAALTITVALSCHRFKIDEKVLKTIRLLRVISHNLLNLDTIPIQRDDEPG